MLTGPRCGEHVESTRSWNDEQLFAEGCLLTITLSILLLALVTRQCRRLHCTSKYLIIPLPLKEFTKYY